MKRLLCLLGLALLILAIPAAVMKPGEGALGFDPRLAPPPWKHRCSISMDAYEDGSASLYCEGRKRRFGTIDAESGRIRIRIPH